MGLRIQHEASKAKNSKLNRGTNRVKSVEWAHMALSPLGSLPDILSSNPTEFKVGRRPKSGLYKNPPRY